MPAAKIHAKRGPKTALEDDALLALIRPDLAASAFSGEGHRKVHARLHFVACHKVGRNRVLRAHNLLSPHRAAFAPAKAHDGRIITDAPNVRWATDGAKIWTHEAGWFWLFDLLEHWNGECLPKDKTRPSVGLGGHVCKIGDRFAAWEPLAQAVAGTLGGVPGVPGAARGIELRRDHGSHYLTDYFRSTYGYSRDSGFDCKRVRIGLVCTSNEASSFSRISAKSEGVSRKSRRAILKPSVGRSQGWMGSQARGQTTETTAKTPDPLSERLVVGLDSA